MSQHDTDERHTYEYVITSGEDMPYSTRDEAEQAAWKRARPGDTIEIYAHCHTLRTRERVGTIKTERAVYYTVEQPDGKTSGNFYRLEEAKNYAMKHALKDDGRIDIVKHTIVDNPQPKEHKTVVVHNHYGLKASD